jgi:hypothetical protein
MDQTDAFLATTLPRLRQADTALHNGDAGLRKWRCGPTTTR